jgi:hypothetical protein
MTRATTIGIDTAKRIFFLHGENGRVTRRERVGNKRDDFLACDGPL